VFAVQGIAVAIDGNCVSVMQAPIEERRVNAAGKGLISLPNTRFEVRTFSAMGGA
jgi:hypothetical protein